jgi:hypothetical protein
VSTRRTHDIRCDTHGTTRARHNGRGKKRGEGHAYGSFSFAGAALPVRFGATLGGPLVLAAGSVTGLLVLVLLLLPLPVSSVPLLAFALLFLLTRVTRRTLLGRRRRRCGGRWLAAAHPRRGLGALRVNGKGAVKIHHTDTRRKLQSRGIPVRAAPIPG